MTGPRRDPITGEITPMRRSTLLAAACSLSLAATLVAVPSQAGSGSSGRSPQTVATDLAGPLSVAVDDKTGKVYVTQSFAGQLSRINRTGTTRTLVQDPKGPDGELVGASTGPKGTYFIQTNYAAQPHPTSYVKRIDSKGRVKTVSRDLWAHEIAKNPDRNKAYGFTRLGPSCAAELAAWEEANPGGPPLSRYTGIIESHGYQTTVHQGDVYVADAAANAVLKVDGKTGKVRTVAVIPATPVTFTAEINAMFEGAFGADLPDCLIGQKYVPEPVPTDVKVGKDGKLYVTTLQGGLGEMVPLSKVYRVDIRSGKAKAVAHDLHGATGLDLIGKDIIVAEMFAGEVSVIKNGKGRAKVLFTLPEASDVDAKGKTIYATGGVFSGGVLVKYTYRR